MKPGVRRRTSLSPVSPKPESGRPAGAQQPLWGRAAGRRDWSAASADWAAACQEEEPLQPPRRRRRRRRTRTEEEREEGGSRDGPEGGAHGSPPPASAHLAPSRPDPTSPPQGRLQVPAHSRHPRSSSSCLSFREKDVGLLFMNSCVCPNPSLQPHRFHIRAN